ncbi:tetratricopeptide repeat protein [uncultured Roseovarius sp.]|uniref:tetratricopeptide repeat protein n=1 Tax=uncultured Roseovarius sp. TaxID=293344 RepID=UPI0026194978|nr:tetratricopeptide repeat protein [uncultured Roseovarius sp.]
MAQNTRIAQLGFPGRVYPARDPFMLLAGKVSMIEKPLHAGNIAVAIASAATAADLSMTGGAGAAITTMLSSVELFKKSTKDQKYLAKSMAAEMQGHLDHAHLTPDRRKIIVQMLESFPPGKTDLAAGNMDAPTIAANMCAQIRATSVDDAHRTAIALEDYASILTATLTPYLEPRTEEQAMLQELLARTRDTGQQDRLHDEGITEKAIIRLAQRIAGDTDDLGQAWLELQNAIDIAVRVQQEGRVTSNHGDFVDEMLKRVADLAADGDYASASAEITEALAAEDATHQARKTRLLESGIEVAMLQGDAARSAELLVQKADLEAGGHAEFENLRTLQDNYFTQGRDKGVSEFLKVSINIAKLVLARTTAGTERGTILNNVGNALAVLGQSEINTKYLLEAVENYKFALVEFPRHSLPLNWAATQMNLGNALTRLGEREKDSQQLIEAVTAYENALQEWARDRMPLDWATAQMNLGNVLQVIGERENDSERLTQAVQAYESALEERTRDRAPHDWASTQMNYGLALRIFGERERNTERLNQAVQAFKKALQVWTRDNTPLQWAATLMNLGTALQAIGALDGDKYRFAEARVAYESALKEYTSNRMPLDWAMTQYNLANLELAFFDNTDDPTQLNQAMIHAEAAQEVFSTAKAS